MTQPPLPPTINPLDYAPDAMPEFFRRRRRRVLLVAAVFLALAIAFFFRQAISLKARQLYWARQCARFTAPAATPTVVSDPAEIVRLSSDPDYWDVTRNGAVKLSISPQADLYEPRAWREFVSLAGVGSMHFSLGGTVFLHELRTPSGQRRIVRVEASQQNILSFPEDLRSTVIEPPGVLSPPRVLSQPIGYGDSGSRLFGRLHFGQADPTDRSHFTIGFEPNPRVGTRADELLQFERKGIIDGYLGDDDKITFRVRDPASTRGL